jgi:hypothetical protein
LKEVVTICSLLLFKNYHKNQDRGNYEDVK